MTGAPRSLDRRRFIELGLLAAAAVPAGCASTAGPEWNAAEGRLQTRWKVPTEELGAGEHPLGLGSPRDGYIRVPPGYQPTAPAPLALLLHGASQSAREWRATSPLFDQLGVIALGVDSRDFSWDLRYGSFGPDVQFIDLALAHTFERCHVDPARLAIAGFSDGASYALSLGLINGDLFTHVLGFSPGFVVGDGWHGTPPVFLSHGAADPVLPVAFTRGLASELRGDGYEVVYREFQGGHTLPSSVAAQGFEWFANGSG